MRLLPLLLLAALLVAAAPCGAAEPLFFWHDAPDAEPETGEGIVVEVSDAHPAFGIAFPSGEAFATLRDTVHARALDDGAPVKDPALERAFPSGETYWFLGATKPVGLPLSGCRLTYGAWNGLELLFPLAEKAGRVDPLVPHLVARGPRETPGFTFRRPEPELPPEAVRSRFLAALDSTPVLLAPDDAGKTAALADLAFAVRTEADTEPVAVGFTGAFRLAEHARFHPGRYPLGGRWLAEIAVPKAPGGFACYACLALIDGEGRPVAWVNRPSDGMMRYPVRGLARLDGGPHDAIVAGSQYLEGDFPALLRWDGLAYVPTPLGGGGL